MSSGGPNYLRQEISIARQRIHPRIQLTSQLQQWGNCYNLVTVGKHACIVAADRPTIDNNGSPRLYKELRIDYHSSLEYELITSSSLRKILRSGLSQSANFKYQSSWNEAVVGRTEHFVSGFGTETRPVRNNKRTLSQITENIDYTPFAEARECTKTTPHPFPLARWMKSCTDHVNLVPLQGRPKLRNVHEIYCSHVCKL
jgi:hypothetical protein